MTDRQTDYREGITASCANVRDVSEFPLTDGHIYIFLLLETGSPTLLDE